MSGVPPERLTAQPLDDPDELAVLRRIARLVAEGALPSTLFPAVLEAVGELFRAPWAGIARYERRCAVTIASWSRTGEAHDTGCRTPLEGGTVPAVVFDTHRPALIARDAPEHGAPAVCAVPDMCLRTAAVGAPIRVGGLLWGLLAVAPTTGPRPPPGAEERLALFADVTATGIWSADARNELRRIADEQAAMRRLALLVARGVEPPLLFAAVAEEVGVLFDADAAAVTRYRPDGEAAFVGASGWVAPPRTETAGEADPRSAIPHAPATGHPHRWDQDDPASAGLPESLRREGFRSAVDAPVFVEGRLWGGIVVASRRVRLAADTEQRLAEFNELVATAIAGAEARGDLIKSRARIVATADQARRRIERDLHDGAQQRLVSLTVQLRAARLGLPADVGEVGAEIDRIAVGLTDVLDDLRTLARGIHPPILAEGGLRHAVMALARRSAIPVDLELSAAERLPQPVEGSAYYIVAEAMTNAVKHSQASTITIRTESTGGVLRILVRDDGVGGADFAAGTGLVGIKDRVEALGGRMSVDSPSDGGTAIRVELPLTGGNGSPPPPGAGLPYGES